MADLSDLQEEGDPDLLKELMELFLADVPLQLIVLRKAVDAGDVSSVERIVHTLKGSRGTWERGAWWPFVQNLRRECALRG